MRDVVSGVVVAAIGVFITVEASRLPDAPSVTNDPALFPQLIGILLIVTGLAVVGQGVYRLRTGVAEPDGSAVPLPDVDGLEELQAEHAAQAEFPDLATTGLIATLIVVYGYLAFRVGYLSMTFVFLLVGPVVLSWSPRGRRALVLGGYALGMVAAIRLIFVSGLNVPLPDTPLP